jgi:hypothetical protein
LHDYLSGCIVVKEVNRNNYMEKIPLENTESVHLQESAII